MPAPPLPTPDFELLFAAWPAPAAALAPNGTVLALNTALTALVGPNLAQKLPGQPLAGVHQALAAAGHGLAPAEAWATALQAAQDGACQVLRPVPGAVLSAVTGPTACPNPPTGMPAHTETDGPALAYWEATLQPVSAPPANQAGPGELRYLLLHLLNVSEQLRPAPGLDVRRILDQLPLTISTMEGPDHTFTFLSAQARALMGPRAAVGRTVAECLPEVVAQGYLQVLNAVRTSGQPVFGYEEATELLDPATNQVSTHYNNFGFLPLRGVQATGGVLAFGIDVTEQVLARQRSATLQAEVQAADLRLRHQAEVLPIITFATDAAGLTTYMSPQWYAFTGQPPGGPWAEVDAMWAKCVHPDDQDRATDEIQQSIADARLGRVEVRLRGADGQYRWFLTEAVAELDATGHLHRRYGFMLDVHELRLTQNELSASEEELRIQAESIPQQVWTARPEGIIDFYNHRTAAYLGEAMGGDGVSHWLSFVHPDDRATAQERWVQAIATQRYYEAEFRLRRYDGQYRWFLSQAQARRAPGGQVLKWYGTNTDVHQQRVLQEQVLASQARFQQLLETLPQMAWTTRPDGSTSYYSQRWYDYTGATVDELREQGWEQFLHPDDLAATAQRWQHSIATGEAFETENRWRDRLGHYRWFLARGEAIRDKSGAIAVWVGTNTDVHDFKQVQQQLEAQNARLVRTNNDLDNFVYTASHDLKQPINNMAGIFEELTRTAYFRDPDAIKLITYFERALAQIFATIDNLSAIVQGQRQQQEIPPEDVALAPLVAEIIGSLQDQITETGATFELDFATGPVVHFVRPNLQSALFNLIGNALKYAAPGRPPRISLRSTPDLLTGHLLLTVQDNGLGIDLVRYGPQLFQLFRRFHTHVEGTGMGLYLVNRIVQNHGGRLEVSSTVGEGTTFRLYL